MSRLRVACLIAFAACVSVAFMPGSIAQQEEACRRPIVEVAEAPTSWSPGERFVVQIAVVNENERPVESVAVRLEAGAPPGWTASLSRGAFTLGPKNVSVEALTLTAPQRGSGLTAGEVVLSVHFTCHRRDAQAEAYYALVLPVTLAPAAFPWLVVGGVIVAVTGSGVAAYVIRSRRPPIYLIVKTPQTLVAPGRSAQFPFTVGNRARDPDSVELRLEGVPDSWAAFLAVDDLELEPREERSLWLRVRAPKNATRGAVVTILLRVTSKRPPASSLSVDVRVQVEASTERVS